MKRVLPFAIALVIILAFWMQTPAEGGGKEWLTDMDQAIERASTEKKDLLLDFTGSDWCGWCIRLNEEVFTKPDFEKAKDHFVMVELDFPADESKVTAETRAQNEKWQAKLGVEGFPTIFLADSLGRPYAMTGYREGGVGAYLEHLAELRQIRELRDKAFAAANSAAGEQRARHLHEGLSAMHGDFVIANYRDEVQQIIALDAENKTGLSEQYKTLLAESDARQKAMEIVGQFESLANEKGLEAAAALLEEELAKAADNPPLRHKIQVLRVNYVPIDKLSDAADVFDELLTSQYMEEAEKLNLRLQRADWLAKSGKVDEAAREFDEVIAGADGNDLKSRLFYMKAELLETNDKRDEALAAYGKMIELAEKGSDAWVYGQQRSANLLVALGRPQEGLAIFERVLEVELQLPIKVNILSCKAAAQLAAGQREAAVETAENAKKLAAAVEVSEVADFWLGDANQRIEAVLTDAGAGK
jgi:thioredoxin-related protein/tetratricopeptide (TPR) repeat protein